MLLVTSVDIYLQQKLERGSHKFKEEMVLCLMDMVEDPKIVRDKMKLMSNGLI